MRRFTNFGRILAAYVYRRISVMKGWPITPSFWPNLGIVPISWIIIDTCSTYSVETSCGPPRQGQHVTMTTPLSTASLIVSIRSVLESGILPLPYVTMTTPSIGGCKHPFIWSKKTELLKKNFFRFALRRAEYVLSFGLILFVLHRINP